MLKFSLGGAAMAAVHVVLLAITVALILDAGKEQWPTYWTIFLALDFPVSLAVIPLAWIFPPSPLGPIHDFANFWWPLGVHGVLGTLWWTIVGNAISERLARRRERAIEDSES